MAVPKMRMFKAMKQKKKRAVDPNAPPRPNLMSHDKKIRETTEAFGKLHSIIGKQQEHIQELEVKFKNMQQAIGQIVNYIKGKD